MNRETSDTTLANGLRVVVVRTPGAPLAEVRLVLPYARTAPHLAEAHELLAACLGTGTAAGPARAARTRQDVADHTADLGAELSTVVTAESLVMAASVLAPGLPGVLSLLTDLLLHPAYRDRELALARRRTAPFPRVPGPRQRLRGALLGHAFGAHPLVDAPTAPATATTTEDLHALHARAVVPDGAVLLVTTSDRPDEVSGRVRELLGSWSGEPSGLVLPPFARRAPRPGRVALTTPAGSPGAGQALVLCAAPAVPVGHPAHAPLHLAQSILGGSASSRLARRIRDRHGLAYAVSADLRGNRAGDWLEIACAGAPGTAGRIADEITRLLEETAGEGFSREEVERARAYASGFTRFALATRTEEASALAGFAAAGLPLDWLATYRNRLAEVTHRQVAEAAGFFFDPARAAVATSDDATSDDTGPADATPQDHAPDRHAPEHDPHHDQAQHEENDRWTP
ncbi:insulinase family protein [Streptomyces sp. NPDC089922]|uniref:M16 family metallopeptidase n=1 Tax=unclassified Streptomyces TaxID=2593676 RepID=UPI00342D5EAC